MRRRLLAIALALLLALPAAAADAPGSDRLAYALTGGRLILAPGRVGRGLAAPTGAVEVDGRGKHVTPGIIDAHSHTAMAGKDATFIVTDGDILDLRSRVVAACLDGRALDLTDKQKRLYEKYRNRPTPAAGPTEGKP
jgi:hypothetical protein